MAMKSTMAVIVIVFGLGGCTMHNWQKSGASIAQRDGDLAQCAYEAELATPGSGVHASMNNSIAAGMQDGMRIAELKRLCMIARGYTMTANAK